LDRFEREFSAPDFPGWEERKTMKASEFSDAQKAFILKQGADGTPVQAICRKAGISQATYCNWQKKYDRLLPTEMRRQEDEKHQTAKAGSGSLAGPRDAAGCHPPKALRPARKRGWWTRPVATGTCQSEDPAERSRSTPPPEQAQFQRIAGLEVALARIDVLRHADLARGASTFIFANEMDRHVPFLAALPETIKQVLDHCLV
jgi:putative transposase